MKVIRFGATGHGRAGEFLLVSADHFFLRPGAALITMALWVALGCP